MSYRAVTIHSKTTLAVLCVQLVRQVGFWQVKRLRQPGGFELSEFSRGVVCGVLVAAIAFFVGVLIPNVSKIIRQIDNGERRYISDVLS